MINGLHHLQKLAPKTENFKYIQLRETFFSILWIDLIL